MSSPPDFKVTEHHLVGLDELRKRWGTLVGLGVLLVVLGMIAISASMIATLATVVFFGTLMMVGGVSQTIYAIMTRAWSGFYLDLLAGVLSLVIGFLIVGHPGATAMALTLLIAVFLIVGGIFRIAIGFSVRYQIRIWLFLHGALNVLLGVIILMDWPLSGLWVIGLFIGIDMLFNGWSLIMLGLAAKNHVEAK